MKKSVIAVAAAAGLCLVIVSQGSAASGASKSAAQITRGEYLVKAIGQCGDCHTPFNAMGGFVMDKWLQGKKLEFGPLIPIPIWAEPRPTSPAFPDGTPARRCNSS